MNDFILTYTGRKFRPLDPNPEDINLTDIIHALAHTCRFTGHVKTFYSVAEHSILVSRRVAELGGSLFEQLAGLLHDASEAYLCDIATPVKARPEFAAYREAERRLQYAINDRFGLIGRAHQLDIVKQADADVFSVEAEMFMPKAPGVWPAPKVLRDNPWGVLPGAARIYLREAFIILLGREVVECTR